MVYLHVTATINTYMYILLIQSLAHLDTKNLNQEMLAFTKRMISKSLAREILSSSIKMLVLSAYSKLCKNKENYESGHNFEHILSKYNMYNSNAMIILTTYWSMAYIYFTEYIVHAHTTLHIFWTLQISIFMKSFIQWTYTCRLLQRHSGRSDIFLIHNYIRWNMVLVWQGGGGAVRPKLCPPPQKKKRSHKPLFRAKFKPNVLDPCISSDGSDWMTFFFFFFACHHSSHPHTPTNQGLLFLLYWEYHTKNISELAYCILKLYLHNNIQYFYAITMGW